MVSNKDIRKFSCIYFVNMMGLSIINGVFVVLLSVIKGFTPIQVSFMVGIMPLLSIFPTIMWGRVIDKDKKLMKWSRVLHCLHALSIMLLILIDNFWLFSIMVMVRNILLRPAMSVLEEYITNISATSGVNYGQIRGKGTIGFGIVGVISPFLIMLVGVEGVIWIGALIVLVTGVMFGTLPEVRLEDEGISTPKKEGINWGLMRNKEYLYILLISGTMMGALNAAGVYGTQAMLVQYNCPEALIGTLPFMMTVIEIVILFNIHRFKVEQKPYTILGVAGGFLMIRWIICLLATGYMAIILATLIHGVMIGCGLVVLSQLLRSVVKESERSSAFLICATVQSTLIPSIINFITGITLDRYGVSSIAILYMILTGIGIIMVIPKVIKENKCVKV